MSRSDIWGGANARHASQSLEGINTNTILLRRFSNIVSVYQRWNRGRHATSLFHNLISYEYSVSSVRYSVTLEYACRLAQPAGV